MFILYNILFYILLIYKCQSTHSSLLSRLKNTYLYESTANIEILPQDYFIDEFQTNYSYPSIYIKAKATDNERDTEKIDTHNLPVIKFRDTFKNKYLWRPTLGYTKGVPTLPAEIMRELESLGRTKEDIISESEIRRTLSDQSTITTEVTRTLKGNYTATVSVTRTSTMNISSISTTSPFTSTFSRTWKKYFTSLITAAHVRDTFSPTRSSLTEETSQTTILTSETTYAKTVYSQFSYETTTSPDISHYLTAGKVIDPNPRFVLKKLILKPIWMYAPNETSEIVRVGNHTHTKRGVPRCYTCGLDVPGLSTSDCYDIFEGDDERKRQKMYKKRTRCSGPDVIGGCFKRYLDVGSTYNERGCRSKPPLRGKSYASRRLMLLEYLLHNVNDGCVASPHATLTPFSRSVSLYARFHVCVCSQRYCNGSTVNYYQLQWILLIILWR